MREWNGDAKDGGAERGRGGGVRTWTQREGNGGPERGGWRPRESGGTEPEVKSEGQRLRGFGDRDARGAE